MPSKEIVRYNNNNNNDKNQLIIYKCPLLKKDKDLYPKFTKDTVYMYAVNYNILYYGDGYDSDDDNYTGGNGGGMLGIGFSD